MSTYQRLGSIVTRTDDDGSMTSFVADPATAHYNEYLTARGLTAEADEAAAIAAKAVADTAETAAATTRRARARTGRDKLLAPVWVPLTRAEFRALFVDPE